MLRGITMVIRIILCLMLFYYVTIFLYSSQSVNAKIHEILNGFHPVTENVRSLGDDFLLTTAVNRQLPPYLYRDDTRVLGQNIPLKDSDPIIEDGADNITTKNSLEDEEDIDDEQAIGVNVNKVKRRIQNFANHHNYDRSYNPINRPARSDGQVDLDYHYPPLAHHEHHQYRNPHKIDVENREKTQVARIEIPQEYNVVDEVKGKGSMKLLPIAATTTEFTTVKTKPVTPAKPKTPVKPIARAPTILFWDPIFTFWQAKRSMTQCPATVPGLTKTCHVTTNRSELAASDVVVFHPFQLSIYDLPPPVKAPQKWVFVSQESPANLKARNNPSITGLAGGSSHKTSDTSTFPYPTVTGWESLFDWLVTYTMDSDVHFPYSKKVKLNPDPSRKLGLNFEQLKNRKLVIAIVSNCQSKRRMDYILKLKKLLPQMELYGKCFGRPVCMDQEVRTKPLALKKITTTKLFELAAKRLSTLAPYYASVLKLTSEVSGSEYEHTPSNPYHGLTIPAIPQSYSNAFSNIVPAVPNFSTLGNAGRDVKFPNTKYERISTYKKNHTCLKELASSYKFIIGIENSKLCPDYITEKYWSLPLKSGSIPIVGGTSKATYSRLAIPNSYIHIEDFTNIELLAEYMKSVDKDPKLQLKYLEWRRDWRVEEAYYDTWCDLCQKSTMVHEGKDPGWSKKDQGNLVIQQKNTKKFNKWWNGCSSYY